MMKATSFKRGSRKKQQPQPAPQPQQSQPAQHAHQDRPREERPQVVMQHHNGTQVRPTAEQHQRQKEHDKMTRRASSQRREPPPEQIELTKKNYRLAKELSELRVRHREECKNVTRLTMENMNLASRCREAISHVAMLKKELANHQKRAQEALKFQREQTQRMASNLSAEASRLSQSYSASDSNSGSAASTPNRPDKSEMERLLSSIEPPPPPPPRKVESEAPPMPSSVVIATKTAKTKEAKDVARTVSPEDSSSDEDDTVEDTRHGRSVLDVVESLSDLSSPPKESGSDLPPRVYSTPNRRRKEDRWQPNIDSAPGSGSKDSDGMSLFPHSASPKVVGPGKHRNYNEEFPMDIMPNQAHRGTRDDYDDDYSDDGSEGSDGLPHTSLLDRHRGMITLNSIDAFEASFDTTFPSAFSNRENSSSRQSRISPQAVEIYNPFAPSPARSERSAPSTPPSKRDPSTLSSEDTPVVVRKARASDSVPFTLQESERQSWKDSLQYETPPKELRSAEDMDAYGEPSRPHKTASAEARQRYEKALQPRNGSANLSSEASVTTTNAVATTKEEKKGKAFSPSNLLKRIQSRRKYKDETQQQEDLSQPSEVVAVEPEFFGQYSPSESSLRENTRPDQVPSSNHPLDPQGISARELSGSASSRSSSERHFDEKQPDDGMAPRSGGISARLNSLKHYNTRRSTNQPISYAEPALNTKIRQGHTFFPKHDGAEQHSPHLVTPEAHPPTSTAV